MQYDIPEIDPANACFPQYEASKSSVESMSVVESNTSTKFSNQSVLMTSVQGKDETHYMETSGIESKLAQSSIEIPSNKALNFIRKCNHIYDIFETDIFKYQFFREQQKRGQVRCNYISKQEEITVETRAVLIDWFVDVSTDFKLSNTTFYLAVSLVDRILSHIQCPRSKLQLIGTAAIFIAAKMEEIYPPRLCDMVYITDDTYTADQILRMEKIILRVVEFDIHVPLAKTFADFFALFKPISPVASCLLDCLLELSAIHYECIRFKPSRVAAAAYTLAVFCTANKFESFKPTNNIATLWKPSNILVQSIVSLFCCWTDELIQKTNIARDQLWEPSKTLAHLHRNIAVNHRLQAVYSKYMAREKHQVSCAIRMPDEDFFCAEI